MAAIMATGSMMATEEYDQKVGCRGCNAKDSTGKEFVSLNQKFLSYRDCAV